MKKMGIGLFLIALTVVMFGKSIKDALFVPETSVEIVKYDFNGEPIKPVFSVVQGESGVYYISFNVNAKNSAEGIVYDFSIVDASPEEFYEALDRIRIIDILPGDSTTWSSDMIPTSSFEGLEQPVHFSVSIKGEFTCPSGYSCQTDNGLISAGQIGYQTRTASVSLGIEPDPLMDGSFDVGIDSSMGEEFSETTTTTTIQQNMCCVQYFRATCLSWEPC